MYLDEDLILAILKWRENVQASGTVAPPDLLDWTRNQVCYHAELCHEAGWLRSYSHTLGGDGRDPARREVRIDPLTWSGHEELTQRRAAR